MEHASTHVVQVVMYRCTQPKIADAVVAAGVLSRVITNADDPHLCYVYNPDLSRHVVKAHHLWWPGWHNISVVSHAYALLRPQHTSLSRGLLWACRAVERHNLDVIYLATVLLVLLRTVSRTTLATASK